MQLSDPNRPSRPRVALVSGFWGQNIGNAFFNIGGKWILDQVFGPHNVAFVQDQPGYRTFNNQRKGNPRYDIGLLQHLDLDFIVLQGPMLTEFFPALWRDTFDALLGRGTRIILLSAAFFRYTATEKVVCEVFLRDYPPSLIVTRDPVTYGIVEPWGLKVHNGIDSGFFVPDAYRPFDLAIEPYIALNFDRYPEPDFWIDGAAPEQADGEFAYLGHRWSFRSPAVPSWCSRQGKWQAYLGALVDRRRLPDRLAGRLVLRPEHRFNPHVTWKIYKQPNAIASDEPFTYFSVYANAELTLADRVHACVATLAYGGAAMLFTPSPRAALFDRLGLSEIRKRPMVLQPDILRREKEHQMAFLRSSLRDPDDADGAPAPPGMARQRQPAPTTC